MITRGTTPTLTLTVKDKEGNAVDLSGYDKVWLTLSETLCEVCDDGVSGCGNITIEKDRMTFDGTSNKITICLTQEETLTFTTNSIYAQLRAVKDDTAIATTICITDIGKILKGGAI